MKGSDSENFNLYYESHLRWPIMLSTVGMLRKSNWGPFWPCPTWLGQKLTPAQCISHVKNSCVVTKKTNGNFNLDLAPTDSAAGLPGFKFPRPGPEDSIKFITSRNFVFSQVEETAGTLPAPQQAAVAALLQS